MKRISLARNMGFGMWMLLAAPLGSSYPARAQALTGTSSIAIEAQPVEGAPTRADTATITERLSQLATAQVATSLGKTPLAARGLRLIGTIRLPLSLPPRVVGLRAHDRKGIFVTAHFTLQGADGKSIAEQNVTLEWDDVRWTRGARPWKRNRALDEVLGDAAREAVNRGVWQLAKRNHP